MSFSYSDYGFRSRFLEIDGLQYHYLDEGAGTPVIMLHGNPSWSFMYRHLVEALKNSHRLIVPDHIGCGLSEKPDESRYPYHLARRVSDLEALADRLKLGDGITLVLHDWGGPIGLTFAVRRPERIARLVLFNTTAFMPPGKRLHWTIRWCRNSSWLGSLVCRLNLFAAGATFLGCPGRGMPREVRKAYLAPYASWSDRLAILRFVQDIPLEPSHPTFEILDRTQQELSSLQHCPTLVCWGEKDFVFDLDFLSEWESRLPHAEVHRFRRAGHYVLEDAGPEILPLVVDFLRRHPVAREKQK